LQLNAHHGKMMMMMMMMMTAPAKNFHKGQSLFMPFTFQELGP